MGLNPSTRYPTKTAAPSPQYPWGAARNVTNPGDGTGTPWEQDVVNDLFGMQQALLSGLGYSPSGFPEQVGASQYMAAIVGLSSGRANFFTDTGVVNAAVLTLPAGMQAPAAYFDGMTIRFHPAVTNTGAATVNVSGLGLRDIRSYLDEPLTGGELIATVEATARYVSASNRFVLVRNSSVVKSVVFTTSGNYTPSPGVRAVMVEVQGAGGGGGGAQGPGPGNGGNSGTGGCGGAYAFMVYSREQLPVAPIAVTVGAGGAGGTSGGGGGSAGGSSIFYTVTANGGGGGVGDINPGTLGGGRGADNSGLSNSSAVGGLYSIPGGIGGVGIVFNTNGYGGPGGLSHLSTQAHSFRENIAATNGVPFGGGGAGGVSCNSGTGRAGGNGGAGCVIIWEVF